MSSVETLLTFLSSDFREMCGMIAITYNSTGNMTGWLWTINNKGCERSCYNLLHGTIPAYA